MSLSAQQALSHHVVPQQTGPTEVDRLRQAVRRAPRDPRLKTALGDALASAGREKEAEKAYRDALKIDSRPLETKVKLAGTLLRLGRGAEAERLCLKLLTVKSTALPPLAIAELLSELLVETWSNGGETALAQGLAKLQRLSLEPQPLLWVAQRLMARGLGPAAVEACNLALDRWPDTALAFAELGRILLASGDVEGGILAAGKAVDLDVSRVDARMTLALGLIQASRYQDAEQVFQDALLLEPDSAEVLGNYANMLYGLGRNGEARLLLDRAIARHPDIANLHSLQGLVLIRMTKFVEALDSLDRAIALDPDSTRFAPAKADCLLELDRVDEAVALLEDVLRREPDNAPVICSRARIHIESGDLDAADRLLEQALKIDPNRVQHWNNLGILRKRQFRHAEALAAFEEAGRRFPLSPGALYNKSFALLGVGQLAEGWDHYEVGVHANLRNGWRTSFKPIWNGEALAGKHLGIIAEQGIGDQLMFLSCLEDFAKGPGTEASLSLEVHPKIRSLVARSYPGIEVCDAERTPEKHAVTDFEGHLDYVMYLGSLPAFVRRDHEDFEADGGFLKADPLRVAHWRERFSALGPEPVIGLCWRSMLQSMVRNHWYLALEDLEPIFTLPGARFVSLQYGDARAELAEAERRWPSRILSLEDEVDLTDDLDEVAAVTTALTAVVAPNTTCSFLSAGVGCPTYEFTVGPAWYKLCTDGVPFFPTLKVFDCPFGTPLAPAISLIRDALRRDLGLAGVGDA